MFPFFFIIFLILPFTFAVYPTNNQFISIASNFSANLEAHMNNVVRFNDIQGFFDAGDPGNYVDIGDPNFDTDLMDPLVALLNKKKDSLADIKASAIADYSTLGSEDKSCGFVNAESGNPAGSAYSNEFYKIVSFDTSTVKLAPGVDPKDFDVAEAICSTGGMNSVFKANRLSDPTVLWQYFGSSAGIWRNYPGFYKLSDYDPRLRPWYVAGSSTPRDIIIIVDTSASMNQGDRIGAAQAAVDALLETLTPSDYVMIVTFSSVAKDPFINGDCFSQVGEDYGLVRATPDNVLKLKDYVQNIFASGETNYRAAFEAAFDLFDATKKRDAGSDCQKTILFLTDGVPTQPENELDPTVFIKEKNAKIKARIFTFTLGDLTSENLDDTIPKKIACENNGVYAHIEDNQNLVSGMSSYYLVYALGLGDKDQVVWSSPYYDDSGLGLMITVSSPAFADKYRLSSADPRMAAKKATDLKPFLGVGGVDITMSQLTAHLDQYTFGQTYPFICNRHAEVVYHPLMSPPATSQTLPVYLDILEVEGDQVSTYGIRDAIFNNAPITVVNITVTRSIAAGNVQEDGTRSRTFNISYECKPIPDTPFYMCYVSADVDFPRRAISTSPPPPLDRYNLYHRMDLLPNVTTQSYNETNPPYSGAIISTNRSTVYIASTGWEYPQTYLNNAPYANTTDADNIQLLVNAGTPSVKPYGDIIDLPTIDFTLQLEPIWVNSTTNDTVWQYIGFESGAWRLFPGHVTSHTYNPTLRPWYSRAIAYAGLNTTAISTPYYDASGAGVVITLSRVINRGNSSGIHENPGQEPLEGVVGSDFLYPTFHALFYDSVSSLCDQTTLHCFLIDSSGYLVVHDAFISDPLNAQSPFFMSSVSNLNAVTKDIARLPSAGNPLLKPVSVNDITNEQECTLYELDLDILTGELNSIFTRPFVQASTHNFSIIPVNGTNLFLVAESQTGTTPPIFPASSKPSCDPLIPNACTIQQQTIWDEGRDPVCPSVKLTEVQMDFVRGDEACNFIFPEWAYYVIGAVVFLLLVSAAFYRYKKKSERDEIDARDRARTAGEPSPRRTPSPRRNPSPRPVEPAYDPNAVPMQSYAPQPPQPWATTPVQPGYAQPQPQYGQPGYGASAPQYSPAPSGYGVPPPAPGFHNPNDPPPAYGLVNPQ